MPAIAIAQSAAAPAPVAEYVAFIGEADLHNSNGARLSAPWQVLRQDRANYHRFGIRQAGDEWDPLFADADDRALIETYVREGYISAQAAADIMRGGATVVVRAYAALPRGQWVEVDVYR
ncbi:hypothetical protein KUL25_17920 [Rhodobacteraceae bacterium N5(2021)]|uniref:Uncharacterized protein n=2 Tax=Gymnodinialimonas phycosphaerae TaxID=2841589 RepID=A0A975TZ95_9RHOB|nr:hypothetical protein [Gymnodinialimonas phycosphaerae]MBY4894640.1 hypothetical protein [Gymnodinialimonas phycosphaerae]